MGLLRLVVAVICAVASRSGGVAVQGGNDGGGDGSGDDVECDGEGMEAGVCGHDFELVDSGFDDGDGYGLNGGAAELSGGWSIHSLVPVVTGLALRARPRLFWRLGLVFTARGEEILLESVARSCHGGSQFSGRAAPSLLTAGTRLFDRFGSYRGRRPAPGVSLGAGLCCICWSDLPRCRLFPAGVLVLWWFGCGERG